MTHVELGRFVEHMGKAPKGIVETSVRKAAVLVQGSARANAPVNDGELRSRIVVLPLEYEYGDVRAIVQCDAFYGLFVEMGTGQKGAAEHAGISPDANPVYSMSPWWIHEGSGENEVDRETAEKYKWFYVDTDQGRFYRCTGQAANPFMYPALHDNRDKIKEIFREELEKQL